MALGEGEGRWCRGEFQGELLGWYCQLAQWAAGFSSGEDVLNLLRLGQVEDAPQRPASSAGPRCSRDVGCAATQWGWGPRTLTPPGWRGLSSGFSLLQGFNSLSSCCKMRLGAFLLPSPAPFVPLAAVSARLWDSQVGCLTQCWALCLPCALLSQTEGPGVFWDALSAQCGHPHPSPPPCPSHGIWIELWVCYSAVLLTASCHPTHQGSVKTQILTP